MSASQTPAHPTIHPGPHLISPKKVVKLHKLVLEHHSRLDRLKEDIATAGPGPVSDSLAVQRVNYIKEFEERAQTLSPIRRLSQDVLLCVFEACHSQMSEQQFKETLPNVWPPNIFMQVCQQWRKVSASRSRFWQHISLRLADPRASPSSAGMREDELHQRLSSLAAAVKMWVANSKKLELKLYLDDTQFGFKEDSRTHELLREIWRPLLDASPRWHSIQGTLLYGSSFYHFLLGSEWGKGNNNTDLTIREVSLAFKFGHWRSRTVLPIKSTPLIRARSLRYLDISERFVMDDLYETLPSWTSLTTLSGIWATPYEVYYILKTLPQLKNGSFVCPRIEKLRNQDPEDRVFDEAKALENAQENPIESQLEEVKFVNFPPKLLNQLCPPIKFSRLSSLALKNRRCRHCPWPEVCSSEPYRIITDYGSKGLTHLHLDHACISEHALREYLRTLVDLTHLTLSYSSGYPSFGEFDYPTPVFDDNFLKDLVPDATTSAYQPRLPNLQCLRCDFLDNEHASTYLEINQIKELIKARRHPQSSLYHVTDLQELSFKCRVWGGASEVNEETGEHMAYKAVHQNLADSLAKEGLDVEGLKAQGVFHIDYDVPTPPWGGIGPALSENYHSDYEVLPGGSIAPNLPDEEFFEADPEPHPAPVPSPDSDDWFDDDSDD
ncbi:hypothetical protein EST38_g2835 [Candolleomyces aberdarensis]|uniref:F-box domain-containing protein n=1 Tax=Candolleomyces aberdarensis TaxID=2316362 RepID=A0A4V1Q4R6_9AGAR|nr:hypothetical protein EST38_g2835 [Candolleomyces aberdarensis]